jgi:arsenite methyltransferase
VVDRWARWLLHERFGGDEAALEGTLALLEPIRDRVLDGANLAADDVLGMSARAMA